MSIYNSFVQPLLHCKIIYMQSTHINNLALLYGFGKVLTSPLLGPHHVSPNRFNRKILFCYLLLCVAITIIGLAVRGDVNFGILKGAERYNEGRTDSKGQVVESEIGVVAADDARCSAVGVSMLRQSTHITFVGTSS
ncbi:unnamed protein product [Vicia faba]|uniref:Uncharacterized protein n=1 Tax=Vicia faba TaxID=3906 RepID=A0AAV0Z7N2_VICFA|nr:unnamed protein product [Vicia faba]